MNCMYSENDLALYVEGDLPTTASHAIQMHLPACESCRNIVAELKESQAILRMLREETVSLSALSSVRNRVLGELQSGKRLMWGRWVYALAGGMFVAVVCVGVLFHTRKPEVKVRPNILNVPLRPMPLPLATEIRSFGGDQQAVATAQNALRLNNARPRKRQRAVYAETTTEPVKPVVVKLLTDDPNIVIYWLVEPTGGSL